MVVMVEGNSCKVSFAVCFWVVHIKVFQPTYAHQTPVFHYAARDSSVGYATAWI